MAREPSLQPSPGSYRRWLCAGLALLLILTLLCVFVGVPAAVRALPGRYAARLPGFLQELRHKPHPAILPTPNLAAIASPAPPVDEPTPVKLSGVTFATMTSPPKPGPAGPATPTSSGAATAAPAAPTKQPTATSPPPAPPSNPSPPPRPTCPSGPACRRSPTPTRPGTTAARPR